jgi:hypothetical protein
MSLSPLLVPDGLSAGLWRRDVSSAETKFAHGHTVDMGAVVGLDAPIQGVVLETQCSTIVDAQR